MQATNATMTRTPPWMLSILEEHYEQLQMLWEQRRSALRDLDYVCQDVRELDERIEAHIDALVLAKQHATAMLQKELEGDDPCPAVCVLLRFNEPQVAAWIADALLASQDDSLDRLREALCHAPLDALDKQLEDAYRHGPPAAAAAAAEVFAWHHRLRPEGSRLPDFFQDEDPAVRRTAWRIATWLSTRSS